MAEIIDISSIGDNTSLNLDSGGLTSSNFGPGIELLMNDKKPSSSDKGGSSDINLDDLTSLEAELNDAVNLNDPPVLDIGELGDTIKIEKEIFSDDKIEPDNFNVKFDTGNDPKIGIETLNSGGDNKTWDGYTKFNEIPVDQPIISRISAMSSCAFAATWRNFTIALASSSESSKSMCVQV